MDPHYEDGIFDIRFDHGIVCNKTLWKLMRAMTTFSSPRGTMLCCERFSRTLWVAVPIVSHWQWYQHPWGTFSISFPSLILRALTYSVSKRSESILWYVYLGNNRGVATVYCLNSGGMDVRAVVYGSFTVDPCATCVAKSSCLRSYIWKLYKCDIAV